jgi:hypothetical protein
MISRLTEETANVRADINSMSKDLQTLRANISQAT